MWSDATIFDEKPVDMLSEFSVPLRGKENRGKTATVKLDELTRKQLEAAAWKAYQDVQR